jgi:hypothetical protein
MNTKIDYVTVIEPVYEVTLFGTAELAPWQQWMKEEGLPAANEHGRAELLISVIDSKYMALSFQEFSISIKVEGNRYFLIHAYNSIGWFALAERKVFRTPYYQGDIHVAERRIALSHGNSIAFQAMLPSTVTSIHSEDECWDLLIHLPKQFRQKPAVPHYFHARLEGHTEHFPTDFVSMSITPTAEDETLRRLHASDFRVEDWRIRQKARHSKSKTYQQMP